MTKLDEAIALIQSDPLPADAMEQLEALMKQAPEIDQDKFGDLMEALVVLLNS